MTSRRAGGPKPTAEREEKGRRWHRGSEVCNFLITLEDGMGYSTTMTWYKDPKQG